MNLSKSASKGKLKAHMLEYFREIERSGQELIVIDHNKPVLRIVPMDRKSNTTESVFRKYRHKVEYNEDITSPTTNEWNEV